MPLTAYPKLKFAFLPNLLVRVSVTVSVPIIPPSAFITYVVPLQLILDPFLLSIFRLPIVCVSTGDKEFNLKNTK